MPADTSVHKARYLRALERDLKQTREVTGADGRPTFPYDYKEDWGIIRAEYTALFPDGQPQLEPMLTDTWIEERVLLGRWYDVGSQCWYHANGEPVRERDER